MKGSFLKRSSSRGSSGDEERNDDEEGGQDDDDDDNDDNDEMILPEGYAQILNFIITTIIMSYCLSLSFLNLSSSRS